MKKFLIIICLLISTNSVYATGTICPEKVEKPSCECKNSTKCLDLMASMYNERAALYNVLNLSNDQQKCKDVIDKKRYEELGNVFKQYEHEKIVYSDMCKHNTSKSLLNKQKKVVKSYEKQMKSIGKKYDKEFKTVLNSEQKSKLNTIRKMEKKEINYCNKHKAFYKRDPKLRPFGEKMYYGEQNEVLCPVHKKWHIFGIKHNEK